MLARARLLPERPGYQRLLLLRQKQETFNSLQLLGRPLSLDRTHSHPILNIFKKRMLL